MLTFPVFVTFTLLTDCEDVLPEPVMTSFEEFESFLTVFDKVEFVLFFTGFDGTGFVFCGFDGGKLGFTYFDGELDLAGFDGAALDFAGFADELELGLDGFELLL